MRLWLDDLRPMPKDFDIWAKNADDAIKYLWVGKIDHISFDHDLGEGKTGYDIAQWVEHMAYNKQLPKFTWKVHSANPIGAERIKIALSNADMYWGEINERLYIKNN